MEMSSFVALLLLVFIPFADACIPTKTPEPGIPAVTPNPTKECGVLDQWDKTSCENSGTFPNGCLAPSTASTTMFTCPAGSGLVFDAPPGPLPLNSLTCDTAKGEWILENIQGDKKTITELMGLIPGPYKFYCAK